VNTPLKQDIPLLETPQAVSVIDRALIVDQGAEKLEDVVKNAAGVSVGGYYANWDYLRIRGFDASGASVYLDGLITGDWNPGEETWNMESVEVIKGPASTLFGQGPLGGFVNIVSKRPKHEFGGEVRVTGGTWDFYQGAIDINVPLLVPAAPALAQPSAKGA
jgi:iron complex outermembrane receptor protein